MNLGEFIKNKRYKKDISGRELSRRSGISQAYLSQIETGKNENPTRYILSKLSKGLGVSYSEISGYSSLDDDVKEYITGILSDYYIGGRVNADEALREIHDILKND